MADSQRKTANLFDLTTNRTSYSCSVSIDNNGNVTQTNSGSYARSEWTFENLEANKYYTLKVKYSNPNSNSVRLNILNSNAQTIITSDVETDISGDLSVTFQAQGGNTFIRLYSNTLSTVTFTAVVFFDIMLNEGETALPYEPYSATGWIHSLRKFTTATEAVENPLYSDGTAITSYTIKGNTVQNGTPTPSNPVDVVSVGERTEQLIPEFLRGSASSSGVNFEQIDSMTIRAYGELSSYVQQVSQISFKLTAGTYSLWLYSTNSDTKFYPQIRSVDGQTTYRTGNGSFTLTEDTVVVPRFVGASSTATIIDENIKLMLNVGSQPLPFEPYGYKIPIPSGQQTIDIYIGDLPLLKSLDGTAVDEISNGTLTRRVDADGSVLPTPITTQITMPSIPTTEGANSITVDTTVQPSEFTATWTGWHNAEVKEKSDNLIDMSMLNDDTNLDVGGRPYSFSGRVGTMHSIDVSDYDDVTLSFDVTGVSGNKYFIYSIFNGDTLITRAAGQTSGSTINTSSGTSLYLCFYVTSGSTNVDIDKSNLQNIMLNAGSTALPYEPYWK